MMQEAAVRGVAVAGVGRVPRAYIALKPGFSLPGEELATWLNSRLEWRHRWGTEGETSLSKEKSVNSFTVCVSGCGAAWWWLTG